MVVRKVDANDFDAWLDMGLELWPEYSKRALRKEFIDIYGSKREDGLICVENGAHIGFVNVSVRLEFVPGTHSRPVGYVEGIFVKQEYRRQGYARLLLFAAEKWAKRKGCKEMASDTHLHNTNSIRMHERLGFTLTERIQYFSKKL